MRWFNKPKIQEPTTPNQLKGAAAIATTTLTGNVHGDIKKEFNRFDPSQIYVEPNAFNTTSMNTISDVNALGTAYENNAKNSQLFSNIVTWHKNFNINKYKYEVDEKYKRCFFELENKGFMSGSLMSIMINEKLYFVPFVVKDYDFDGYPKTVNPVLDSSYNEELKAKMESADYVVGETTVIFQPEQDGLWTQAFTFGKLYKFWKHYEDIVMISNEVFLNHLLTRERLLISGDNVEESYIYNLIIDLYKGKPVLHLDEESFNSKAFQGLVNKDGALKFEDRFQSLAEQFKFFIEIIKMLDGGMVDASPYKKERNNTKETTSQNSATLSILKVGLELREMFVKELSKVHSIKVTVTAPELEEYEAEPEQEYSKESEDYEQ